MKLLLAATLSVLFLCPNIKANPPVSNLNSADNLALNTPQYIAKNMATLIAYGQSNTQSEMEMTRFLFVWIAENIQYDSSELYAVKRTTAKQLIDSVFDNRKGICRGYADLLTALCQKSGIYARTVTGYAKSSSDRADTSDFHAWNAIRIDGIWHLFDVTWASNYFERTHEIDRGFEQYFLQNNNEFIKRHFPFDPVWQLNNDVMARAVFFNDTTEICDYSNYFQDFNMTLQEESTLSVVEQNLKSFERAVVFIPEEKKLHGVLNYYKSEKAHYLFEKANLLLDKFRNKSDAELKLWTIQDFKTMIDNAKAAKICFDRTLYLYQSMTFTVENEDSAAMKSNIQSIQKNRELTDKLIDYLKDIVSTSKQTALAKAHRKN